MDLKNFGQAIRELAEEKGVAVDKVVFTVETAIAAAYKKEYGKRGQIIRAKFDPESGALGFWQVKIAVDETMIKSEEEIQSEEEGHYHETETHQLKISNEAAVEEAARMTPEEDGHGTDGAPKKIRFNPERHIMIDEARLSRPDVMPGDEIEFRLEAKYEFGRIASQTAKQVIIQRIREAEREATYAEYKEREGQIVSGTVQRIEGKNVFIDLGRGVGVMTQDEQIPHERFRIGDRLKTLVLLVGKETRGPGIFLSRSHPQFLKKLFEIEVPELMAGTVEIKAMAREPGSRSKVSAASNDAAVDPVGSLVGQRGVRVSTVINEIGGEKIDIVEYSSDPATFIANALSPAKVLQVELAEERKEALVTVPSDQLSLAIGKGGQNVRLAAKLAGWKIDVRSRQAPSAAPATDESAAKETTLKAAAAEKTAKEAGPVETQADNLPAGESETKKEDAAAKTAESKEKSKPKKTKARSSNKKRDNG